MEMRGVKTKSYKGLYTTLSVVVVLIIIVVIVTIVAVRQSGGGNSGGEASYIPSGGGASTGGGNSGGGDDDGGIASECVSGATGTCTVNNCAGTKTCVGGSWGVCVKTNPSCGTGGGVLTGFFAKFSKVTGNTASGDDDIYYDDGYVGIGIDEPEKQLHVDGDVYFEDKLIVDKNVEFGNDLLVEGDLEVRGTTNCSCSGGGSSGGVWSSSGSNIYYNGGNVGIGTSTPSAKLDVAGTLKASGVITFDTNPLRCTIRSQSGKAPEGVTASCSSGEILTGGGCYINLAGGAKWTAMRPTSQGYYCLDQNDDGRDVAAYAVCCKMKD